MLCFHSLIGVTKCYVLSYITLHLVPQVGKLEILIHFISSRVNGVCRIMSFSEYEVLNFLIIRYTDPLLEHTLIIFSESKGLAFRYVPPDLLELFVLLTLAYILRKH
jgi:hypothetical protein